MSTMSLVPFRGDDPLDRAAAWADLPEDERKRRAVAAAHAHHTTELQDLAEAWLTLYGKAGATLSPYTRRNYRHGVRELVDAWAHETLLRPTRNAGALWLRRLEGAGLKPATVQIRLAAARSLYAALRWTGATTADPFEAARPARDKTPAWERRQPYRQEEIDALLAQATPDEQTLILLASQGGLRVSECLALRHADVSFARRDLVVRGKGQRQRRVPLSRSLSEALLIACRSPGQGTEDGYVLRHRSAFPYRQRLKALAATLDVPYRGIHAFRHACGTRLVTQMHGDLESAARLLGHADIETTRVYVKWSDERLRAALETW